MPRKKRTGQGWAVVSACPYCGRPTPGCGCRPTARTVPAGKPIFRLRLEKRRGKSVTVVAAEGVPAGELKALLKELRSALAAGGGLKGTEIELQGDHRERLREALKGRGTVKG